ncbi:sterol-sensing domain of SREBP cleavage-activation-domain-containing protein [Phlebopus sp. FC_14]|nr:sterol-sensing domain of SREBP cleavage-activation-domain-containing protein [Phlebopus sp. FC_14]
MARYITASFLPYAISLRRIRIFADIFLRSFGIHCATHQIRLILVSAVVITSLSYPALAIYSSSPSYSRLVSTSNVLDTFLKAHLESGTYAQRDLQNFWQGHPNLQIRQDDVARARCGFDRTLRVERVLIRSNTVDNALTYQTLSSALQLERRISERVATQGISCVHASAEGCFVLSPLAFWNHDEERLRSDPNISHTLKHRSNVSVAGIRITPQMVLAGRNFERSSTSVDTALFLVSTFVFPESDCSSSTGHDSWLQILVNSSLDSVDVFAETVEPTLLALEYDHSLAKNSGFLSISSFVYLAYGIFFAYVSWSMKRMNGVHTRIGLTFTALFEIAASTVTSLSVCALMRFKVTMVPWSLLPIVIIFVGAENMFNLVDAVTKTSVTLPVKERIAEGLSRAGTSNTLKVVSYNCVLGILAHYSAGAIRQFCTFAVVVLVAHWFLAHTFFLAVLSIDIQRLELDELLRQNPSLTPSVGAPQSDSTTLKSASWWKWMTYRAKDLLRGRATKNISLFLLLATTATLYVMTRPRVRGDLDIGVALPPATLPRPPQPQTLQANDPAWHLWKVLNPDKDPLVHLRIEVPTIVAFRPDVAAGQNSEETAQSSTPIFDLLVWLLKILPIPMASTLLPLYGLLLYLLKDAELLEAQRNRPGADVANNVENTLRSHVSFSTLPRAFSSDVELLAASADGRCFAAVSLQNELNFWCLDEKDSPRSINTTTALSNISATSSTHLTISAVAVDNSGNHVAFGTAAGAVVVCSVKEKNTRFHEPLKLLGNMSGVKELHFAPPFSTAMRHKAGPYSRPCSPDFSETRPHVIALYHGGGIAQWRFSPQPSCFVLGPTSSERTVQSHFLRVRSTDRLLVAFSLEDGSLEITEICQNSDTGIHCSLQAGNFSDRAATVDACCVRWNDSDRVIICVASEAGIVSLWDAVSSECLSVVDEPHGAVDQIRLSGIRLENCHLCGELPTDSILIALSTGHVVALYRAYVASQRRHCSCPRNTPRPTAISSTSPGRRSRSSSTASASGTPSARRLSTPSNPSVPDTSSFPVSGHGILSRRATEKESLRRPSESLLLPPVIDEYDGGHPLGPLNRPSRSSTVTVVKEGEATCERGGWDTVQGRIVGMRRISRPQNKEKNAVSRAPASATQSQGLTEAALDRWECWSYEPSTLLLQGSVLSSLYDELRQTAPARSKPSDTSSGPKLDYPRLPFTRVAPFHMSQSTGVAGFGNTVGVFHFS